MGHEIRDWDRIKRKTWIRFSDKRFNELCGTHGLDPETTGIQEMEILTRNKTFLRMRASFNDMGLTRNITFDLDKKDFECCIVESPDYQKRGEEFQDPSEVWAQCEQNYGINEKGSSDPCPLRQLAFAILRRDRIALDAARDILKV